MGGEAISGCQVRRFPVGNEVGFEVGNMGAVVAFEYIFEYIFEVFIFKMETEIHGVS